jgi:hypothetical protein
VAPPFAGIFSKALDPTNPQHRGLDWGDGRQVRVTYRPESTSWSVMADFRYGKANSTVPLIHRQEAAGPPRCPFSPTGPYGAICDPNSPSYYSAVMITGINWSDASANEKEEHRIADFAVGKDIGLGLIGDSHSTFRAGLRYAQFDSTTHAVMNGIPDWHIVDGWFKYPPTRHQYRADIISDRGFKGAGPVLSWDAAQRLFGVDSAGHVDVDWSITGGVVFGKQKTAVTGTYASSYHVKYQGPQTVLPPLIPAPLGVAPRSKSASVPVLDLDLGLSYEIQRVKVGAGYHWERYYNALDAGYAEHRSYDRTYDGPYFKIAVGFGG